MDCYVSASNSKDQGKIKALLHPKYSPFLAGHPEYGENWLDYHSDITIPDQREVFVTVVAPDVALPWADGTIWPVRPTNQVQINFKTLLGQNTGRSAFIAVDGGKWYEVISWPKP